MKDFFTTYGAAIAAILGGIAVKIIDKLITNKSETFLEGSKIRDELRSENTSIRQEMEQLELDRNEWREKFYGAVETHINELEKITANTEKRIQSMEHLKYEVVDHIEELVQILPPPTGSVG